MSEIAIIEKTPGIGHNLPPEPTPYEIAEAKITEIYAEARLWLDGAKVDSQELADGIGNLLKLIRDAKTLAEEKKEIEYRPHKMAADEVVERYKPLLKKADDAAKGCKSALQPWLDEQDRKLKAEQARLRAEAEAKAKAAQEAIRAADAANLEAREAAEALITEAKRAEKIANKVSRETVTVGGAFGRSTGLRTEWIALMIDPKAAAAHYWLTRREEMQAFLQTLANRDVHDGKREIPGFSVTDQKVVV
jgi:hypothetical protein